MAFAASSPRNSNMELAVQELRTAGTDALGMVPQMALGMLALQPLPKNLVFNVMKVVRRHARMEMAIVPAVAVLVLGGCMTTPSKTEDLLELLHTKSSSSFPRASVDQKDLKPSEELAEKTSPAQLARDLLNHWINGLRLLAMYFLKKGNLTRVWTIIATVMVGLRQWKTARFAKAPKAE